MLGVDVVIVCEWRLLVVLLMGVIGVFGGCWCGVGSLLVWSGSVWVWWGRFCCWGASGFHALHCCRLSCVWVVVVLFSRVFFLLLVFVVFLFVG